MKFSLPSIIGWTSALLVGALTLFTGVMKFVPVPPGSEQEAMMLQMGMTSHVVYTLGVVELVIATLFLIPRTSTIGFILMIGYFGGVLATLLTHSQDPIVAYIVLGVLTLSAYFRSPELLSRLRKKA